MEQYKYIQKQILELVSKELGQAIEAQANHVSFAYSYAGYSETAVQQAMEIWTRFIDTELDRTDKGGPKYIQLITIRGTTYKEYQALFNATIPEIDFKYWRVCEFYMLNDEIQKRQFIIKYENDFEGYIKSLLSYQVPIIDMLFTKKFGLWFPIKTLAKHSYITGGSGSGKTELLKLMFYDLQRSSQEHRQYSVFLLDPHGDIADDCIGFAMNTPEHKDRIVFLDPNIHKQINETTPYTFCINPFHIKDQSETNIEAMTNILSKAFLEILKDASMTIQMEALLQPCIATVLRMGNGNIKDLQNFMVERKNEYLIALGRQSPNKNHSDFFKDNFDTDFYKSTRKSIYTKLQVLLNSATFDRLVNGKNSVDIQECMNTGKVVILRLPKGHGEEVSRAFGILVIALMQGIALRRVDTSEHLRKPVFLMIDEFANYVTPSIETILTEARKYGLHLILAQQIVGQKMDAEFRRIIMSNTAIKIIGKNDYATFETLARETGLTTKALQGLKKMDFGFYLDNRESKGDPFMIATPNFLVKNHNGEPLHLAYYLRPHDKQKFLQWIIKKSSYYYPIQEKPGEEKKAEEVEQVKAKFDL